MTFEIPAHENGSELSSILQPGLDHIILANSAETSHFRIEYSLKVFVKHEALTERGKGNSVNFNIELKSPPQTLPELA